MSNNRLKAKLNELTKRFENQARNEYEKLYQMGKWKKYIREGTNQEDMEEEAYFKGMREYTFQRVSELTCAYINVSEDISLSKVEVLQYLEGLSANERRKEDAAIRYADGVIEGLKQPFNADLNSSKESSTESIGEKKKEFTDIKGRKLYVECNLKKIIKYDASTDRIYVDNNEIEKIKKGETLFLENNYKFFDVEDDFVSKNKVSLGDIFKKSDVAGKYLSELGESIKSFVGQCNTICYDKYNRKYDIAKAITLIQGFSKYGYKSKEFSSHKFVLSFNMGSREENEDERIAIDSYSCLYRYDSMSNALPDGFVAQYKEDKNSIEKIDAEYFSNGKDKETDKSGVILPGDKCKLGCSTRTGGNIAFDSLDSNEKSTVKLLEFNIVEAVKRVNSGAYDRKNDKYDLIKAVEEWKKEITELNKKCVRTPIWPAIKIFGKDLKDIDIVEDKNGRKLLSIEGVLYKPETNWADFVSGDLSRLQKYNELKASASIDSSSTSAKQEEPKNNPPVSAVPDEESKRCTCISAESNAKLNDERIRTLKQMGKENDPFIDLRKFDKLANIEKGSFTSANKLVVLPENFFLPERQKITYRYIADNAFDKDTVVLNAKEFDAFKKDNDISDVDEWLKKSKSINDLKEWRSKNNTDYDGYLKNRKVMASSAMLLKGEDLSPEEFQERYLSSGAEIKEDDHKSVLRKNEVLAAEWLVTKLKLKQNQKIVLDSVKKQSGNVNTNAGSNDLQHYIENQTKLNSLCGEIAGYLAGMNVRDILNRINNGKEKEINIKKSLFKDCPDWHRIAEIVKGADWESAGEIYIADLKSDSDNVDTSEIQFEQEEDTTDIVVSDVRKNALLDYAKTFYDLKESYKKEADTLSQLLHKREEALADCIKKVNNAQGKPFMSLLKQFMDEGKRIEQEKEGIQQKIKKSEEASRNAKRFKTLIEKLKYECGANSGGEESIRNEINLLTSNLSDESRVLLERLEAAYMMLPDDKLIDPTAIADEIFYGEKSKKEISDSVGVFEASAKEFKEEFNFYADMMALFAELNNNDASYDSIMQRAENILKNGDKSGSLENGGSFYGNVKSIIELSKGISSAVNELTNEEEKKGLAEKNLEFFKEQLGNVRVKKYDDKEAEQKKNEIIDSFNAQKEYDRAKKDLLESIDSSEFDNRLKSYIAASENKNLDISRKAVGEAVSKLNSSYERKEIDEQIKNAKIFSKDRQRLSGKYEEKVYQSVREDVRNILEGRELGAYDEIVSEIKKDIDEKTKLNKKFEDYMNFLKAIEISKSEKDKESSADADIASLVEDLTQDKQEALTTLANEIAKVHSGLKAEDIREFAENVFSSEDEGIDSDQLKEILSKSNSAENEADHEIGTAIDKLKNLLLDKQPKIDGQDGVVARAEEIVQKINMLNNYGIATRFKDMADNIFRELSDNKEENSKIDRLFAENHDISEDKSTELRERIKSESDRLLTNGLLRHVSDGLNIGNIENAYNSAAEAARKNIGELKDELTKQNTKAKNYKAAQQKADDFIQRLENAKKSGTVFETEEQDTSLHLSELADIYLNEYAAVENIGREMLTEFVRDVYLNNKDSLDGRLDAIKKCADIERRKANNELEKLSEKISLQAKENTSSVSDIVKDINGLREEFNKCNTNEIGIKEELRETIERVLAAEEAFNNQSSKLDDVLGKANLTNENKAPIRDKVSEAVGTKLKTEILNEQLAPETSEIISNLESMITQAEANQVKTEQAELIERLNGELSERAKDEDTFKRINNAVSGIVTEGNVQPNRAEAIRKAAELYANQDSQLSKEALDGFIAKAIDGDFSRNDISENQLSAEIKALEEAARIEEHEKARIAILEIEEAIRSGRRISDIKDLADRFIALAGVDGLNQNYVQLSQKINDSIAKHQKALEDIISNSEYLETMAKEREERERDLKEQRERETETENKKLSSFIGDAIRALLGKEKDEEKPDIDAEHKENDKNRQALEEKWQREDSEFKERINSEYIDAVDRLKLNPEDESAKNELNKCLSEFGDEKREFLAEAANLVVDRNSDIKAGELSGILNEVINGASPRKGTVPESAEKMLTELREASHIQENGMLEKAAQEISSFMKEEHKKEEISSVIDGFDMLASYLEGKSSSKYQDMKNALLKSRESIELQDKMISERIKRFDEFTTKQASEEKAAVSGELQSILLADYRDRVECALNFKEYEETDKYKDALENADKAFKECREGQLDADRELYKIGFTEYAKAVKSGEEFSSEKLDQLLSDIPENRKEALKEVFEIFTDRDSQIKDVGSIEYAVDQALSGSFKSADIADKNINGLEELRNDAAIDINKRSREAFEQLLASCTGDVSRESLAQSIKAAREAASDEKATGKYKEGIETIDKAVSLSESFDKTAIGKLKGFDNRRFINEDDKKALKEEFAKRYAEKIDTVFVNNVRYAADRALNGDKNLNSIEYHIECKGMDEVNKAVESRISKLRDEYADKSFENLVNVLNKTKSVADYGKVLRTVQEFIQSASGTAKYSADIAEENKLVEHAGMDIIEKSLRIDSLLGQLGGDMPLETDKIVSSKKDYIMMAVNENYINNLIGLVNKRLVPDKRINEIAREYDGEKAVSDIKVIADKNREVGIACDSFGKASVESISKDEIYKNAETLGRLVKEAAEHEIPLKASYIKADRLYSSIAEAAKERDKQDAEILKQYINSDNAYIRDAAGEFGKAADKLRTSELIDAVREAVGEHTSGRDYTAEIDVMRKDFEDRCQRILGAEEIVSEAFKAIDNVRAKGIDADDKDLLDARNAADEMTRGMNEAEKHYVQTIAQIAEDEFAPEDAVNKIKKDCVKVISGGGLPENSDDLIKDYEQMVRENKKKERQAEFNVLFSDLMPREEEKVLKDYQNRISHSIAVYKRRDNEGPGYKFLDKFESDVNGFLQDIDKRYEQEIERAQEGGNKKLHIVEIKTAEGTKTEKYIDAEGGAFFDGVKYKGGIEEKALDKLREQLAYLNSENAGKYYELESESIDTNISYAKMRNTLPVLKDRTVGKSGKKLANTDDYMVPGLSPGGFEIKEKIKNEKNGVSRIDKTAVKKSDKTATKSAKRPDEKQQSNKKTQSTGMKNSKNGEKTEKYITEAAHEKLYSSAQQSTYRSKSVPIRGSKTDKGAEGKSDNAAAMSAKEASGVNRSTQRPQSAEPRKTRDINTPEPHLNNGQEKQRPKSADVRRSIMLEELRMEFENEGRSKSAGYANDVTPRYKHEKTNNKKGSEL